MATNNGDGVSARLTASLADRYRIERELGVGGMATVYLAHDLKHDRDVAIKVLHPELGAALGGDRFLTEIKTTAKLQHPHILPLLDSGDADGLLYYVMPYVTGETLRSRLERERQLPIDDAVRIAREIADALGAAHALGIVHRDIKPENVLLQGGHALVADFGIALAVQQAAGQRMTQTGLSLGTPQYMSPEQAMGEKNIDLRTDVYALGAVTYEMLAGDAPFTGSSVQAIIAKALSERPTPLVTVRDTVPQGVEAAVLRALAKLPADRFASATAYADALSVGLAAGVTSGGVRNVSSAGATAPRRAGVSWMVAIALVLAAVVATAGITRGLSTRGDDADETAVRLAFSVSPNQPLQMTGGRSVALSPDGAIIVYATADSGVRVRMFSRRLDDLRQEPIPGTENGLFPFFSPDGRSIGFFDGRQLKRIGLEGGTTTTLADIPGAFQGATWTADGIVASIGGVLSMIPGTGGTPVPILLGDSMTGRWPVVLPDGKSIAFGTTLSTADARVAILNLATKRVAQLDLIGIPVGAIDGDLLFLRTDGALMAVPFDAKTARVQGAARVVAPEVMRSVLAQPKAAVSRSGSLVYVSGTGLVQAVLVDMHGSVRLMPIAAGRLNFPRLSPDGKQLVAEASGARTDVWTYDVASGSSRRQTSEGSNNQRGEWSPDGTRVLYRTNRVGSNATYWWQPADGSGNAELLVAAKGRDVWEAQLTPDAQTVVFRVGTLGDADIYYRRLSGDTTTKEVSATKFDEAAPRLSPNGQWIAYQTDESGATEVVVRPFPGPGAKYAVSVSGGRTPLWSRDGKRLFYMNGQQMIEATVATSPSFSVSSRKVLFGGDWFLTTTHASFDITPDGSAMVLLRNLPGTEQIVVIHNFRAALKSRGKEAGAR